MDKLASAIMSGVSKTASPHQIDLWARTASNRYIKNGEELNDTIAKIAEENCLNPQFISRVCEAANLHTHSALLPQEAEKRASFQFPLADPKTIIIQISPKDQGESTLSEFSSPPSPAVSRRPSIADMMGVKEQDDGGESGKRLVIVIEKKAAETSNLNQKLLGLGMQYETLVKQAKALTVSHCLQGEDLHTMHKAACLAGVGNVSAEIFPSVMEELEKHTTMRFEKKAFPVDESLFTRDVPMKVVNGDHAVIAHLRTVNDKEREIDMCCGDISRNNDELRITRRKLQKIS